MVMRAALDAGVLEVWELLCQFSEVIGLPDLPSIADLAQELGVASSPANSLQPHTAEQQPAVLLALVDLLLHEAFDAAIELAAEASPDVKPRDLNAAFPPIRVSQCCRSYHKACLQGAMQCWLSIGIED